MNYKQGDKVTVIPHIEGMCPDHAHCHVFVPAMTSFIGHTYTVVRLDSTGTGYILNSIPGATFSDCMLRLAEEVKKIPEGKFQCQLCEQLEDEDNKNKTEDGYIICNDCYENDTWYCEDCENTFTTNEDYTSINDRYICDECRNENYIECTDCCSWFSEDDTYYCDSCDTRLCSPCMENHSHDDDDGYETRTESKSHFHGKKHGEYLKPDRLIGVEIEAEQGEASEASLDVPPICGFSGDGSLDETGVEVQTPPASRSEAERIIKEACLGLSKNGFTATESCGLHVHIDCHDLRVGQICRVFRTMYVIEDVIYSMLPDSRWDNHYCKPLRKNYSFWEMYGKVTRDQLESRWYKVTNKMEIRYRKRNKYDNSRYSGINVHSVFYKKTIEFRQHSGTINADKICRWIAILLSIIEYSLHHYDKDMIDKLLEMPMSENKVQLVIGMLRLSRKVSMYMRKRISIFNPHYGEIIGKPKPYYETIIEHIHIVEQRDKKTNLQLRKRYSYLLI